MSGTGTQWDLIVIGGGTAGIVSSRTAAGLGARVALVEKAALGGDCLWTGCVPSKALIAAAHHVTATRRATGFGVGVAPPVVDFAAVTAHVKASIATIAPEDSAEAMHASGVQVLTGLARFTGPDTLQVDGREVRFRRAIITTGAGPALPPVPGLLEADPLTSHTVWNLQELPDRLVVLGAGSIGCELGQAFARLGSQVTLIEALPRILAREDPDAARLVRDAFDRDRIQVLAGHTVVGVSGGAGQAGTIVLDGPSGSSIVEFDQLLVAVGRRPNTTGLEPGAAGVELDDRGFVTVDDHLRTSNPRIWAAGDVTPLPPFTHTAGVFGSLAATNAVLGLRRTVDLSAVPRVTFTDPEVAAVGQPTWADSGDRAPRTVTRENDRVDRAVVDDRTGGFSRLTLGKRSRITGATVVGPRAGETLAELTLAVRKQLSTTDLAGTIHPYPTYGDGPWNAAVADVRDRLASPIAQRLAAFVRWLRRAGRPDRPGAGADPGGAGPGPVAPRAINRARLSGLTAAAAADPATADAGVGVGVGVAGACPQPAQRPSPQPAPWRRARTARSWAPTLIAGHETTSTALAWAFERIVLHPPVLEPARSAVAGADGGYLDAVIRESLRSRPPLVDGDAAWARSWR